MTILIGLSLLPFLHELIVDENGTFARWVPNLNIEISLLDESGKILGFSSYRVFLYYFFAETAALCAWLGWFLVAKNKPYRYAILLCIISTSYHLFLILSNSRKTILNNFELKLWATAAIALLLFGIFFYTSQKKQKLLLAAYTTFGSSPKRIITGKVVLGWLALIGVSALIYFHDIITLPRIGLKEWVPNIGIEEALTVGSKNIWGFTSYRAFLLTLCLQIFAHVGWAGWLLDASYKLYRPFLLVPLGLGFHQLTITFFDKADSIMNLPDIKLLILLLLGVLVGILFFFNNKGLTKMNISPQNKPIKHKPE